MDWKNHGEWQIDHIIPLQYHANGEAPTLDETIKRLHYTNTQPLWAADNIRKGNRWVGGATEAEPSPPVPDLNDADYEELLSELGL